MIVLLALICTGIAIENNAPLWALAGAAFMLVAVLDRQKDD